MSYSLLALTSRHRLTFTCPHSKVWLGYTDEYEEGEFTWDGAAAVGGGVGGSCDSTFEKWGTDEPQQVDESGSGWNYNGGYYYNQNKV